MSSLVPAISQASCHELYFGLITVGALLVSVIIFQRASADPEHELRRTHSHIGLSQSESNLRDQYSPAHQPKLGQPPRLQSLLIYPVKSCQGIELTRSRVLPTGLEFDRLYTFAQLRERREDDEDPTWEFLTQRQLPLLASVKVGLWLPKTGGTAGKPGATSGGFLAVRFPWKRPGLTGLLQWTLAKLQQGPYSSPEKVFMLPLDFPSQDDIARRGYEYANVRIWKETTTALNMASEVPVELRQYLGLKNRLGLFRMDPSRQREVFRCAPRKEVAGYQPVVDFHDAYPLHLLSLSSLQDFDSKVEKDQIIRALDARRFRANIIVSGAEPYDEETWRSIRFELGSDPSRQSFFDVSCRTVRCKMPNIDPTTGVRHRVEPDRSLRKFRDVDQGAPKYGCLGMQLCPMFHNVEEPSKRESVLEVGMELSVLQRGPHIYIPQ